MTVRVFALCRFFTSFEANCSLTQSRAVGRFVACPRGAAPGAPTALIRLYELLKNDSRSEGIEPVSARASLPPALTASLGLGELAPL